jgi:hypothetical protein
MRLPTATEAERLRAVAVLSIGAAWGMVELVGQQGHGSDEI